MRRHDAVARDDEKQRILADGGTHRPNRRRISKTQCNVTVGAPAPVGCLAHLFPYSQLEICATW